MDGFVRGQMSSCPLGGGRDMRVVSSIRCVLRVLSTGWNEIVHATEEDVTQDTLRVGGAWAFIPPYCLEGQISLSAYHLAASFTIHDGKRWRGAGRQVFSFRRSGRTMPKHKMCQRSSIPGQVHPAVAVGLSKT